MIGILAVRDSDFSSRVNSRPSIPGSPRSMRISAGLRFEIVLRADSADPLPATSKPAASSTVEASIKLAGSSSTIRISGDFFLVMRALAGAPTLRGR